MIQEELKIKTVIAGNSGLAINKEIKTADELKKFAKEADSFIAIDKKTVEESIDSLINSAENVEVDETNYKDLAASTERQLREVRYAIQAVADNNVSALNESKKQESAFYDDIKNKILTEEKRLKECISAIKNKKAEEKKRKEEEEQKRIDGIKAKIDSFCAELETILNQECNDQSLSEYNSKLDVLHSNIIEGEYEDLKAIAERKMAEYTGKRSIITNKLELAKQQAENERLRKELEEKKLEEEKRKAIEKERLKKELEEKELEAKKAKAIESIDSSLFAEYHTVKLLSAFESFKARLESLDKVKTSDFDFSVVELQEKYTAMLPALKEKAEANEIEAIERQNRKEALFQLRADKLSESGLNMIEGVFVSSEGVSVDVSKVKSCDEYQFDALLKQKNAEIEDRKATEIRQQEAIRRKLREKLNEYIVTYKGLGGSDSKYCNIERIDSDIIDSITKDVNLLKTEKAEKERMEISEELSEFDQIMIRNISEVRSELLPSQYKHKKSYDVLCKMINDIEKVINETFEPYR